MVQQLRLPTSKATKALVERDNAKLPDELLSVLLHDLRSPLGAIGVLVELITTLSQEDAPADPRQLQLLREATVKAERMLDDAVEIQSVIRGSTTFTPALVEIDSVVRTCLEKASHAPYFRNAKVVYDSNGTGQNAILIDVEKAETAILCAFEQVVDRADQPSTLHIHHSISASFVNLHIINEEHGTADSRPSSSVYCPVRPLRGRLGNRRLGESRYSLQVCGRVMQLMGGQIEQLCTESDHGIIMRFPMGTA